MATIVLVVWFAQYSGGPFHSPYGQIVLALPLLSPLIASSRWSIAGVYAVTAALALIFQAWLPVHDHKLSDWWYVAATLSVLAVSGLVSWMTKSRQDKAWKQQQLAATSGATSGAPDHNGSLTHFGSPPMAIPDSGQTEA